jgi:hypothetical protein
MSVSKAITMWIASQPGQRATREDVIRRFAADTTKKIVLTAVNTATRNGWIRQPEQKRGSAIVYERTDVSTTKHYRAPRVSQAASEGSGIGNVAKSELAWRSAMADARFEDAEASVRAASFGRVRRAESSMSLTGSSAAMCAGMLR